MRLNGKIALITGGYRGMGSATARLMAAQGAQVIAVDIIEGTPPDAVAGVVYRQHDVSKPKQWDELAGWIMETYGRIDILVNAAGVSQARSEIHDAPLDEWDKIIAVNQTGMMLSMRMSIGMMLGKGPLSIVNISSIWGLAAGIGQVAYHSSKGAATLMTLNAAVTYAARGIRVNAVLPGLIETEMVRNQDPAMRAETIANTPMRRVGMAEEVAQAIVFLASDDASYITGALVPVDGGFLAR